MVKLMLQKQFGNGRPPDKWDPVQKIGQVLDRIWTGLNRFWAGFGQVLDRFKKSTILDRFWTGSGQVFDGF